MGIGLDGLQGEGVIALGKFENDAVDCGGGTMLDGQRDAIVVIASRCSAVARASVTRPTDQFPFPISSGVKPRMMKPRPSSDTAPYDPRSI